MRRAEPWLLAVCAALCLASGVFSFRLMFAGMTGTAYGLMFVAALILGVIAGRVLEIRRDKRDTDGAG